MNDSTNNLNTGNEAPGTENPSTISILSNIIAAPGKAFADIRHSYPVLLPLMLLLALNAALMVTAFNNIDYEWYTEQMVESQAGDKSQAEQDQVRQGFSFMSGGTMGLFAVVGVFIGLGVAYSLQSLYLVIVSGINNDGFEFKQWFSLVTWSQIPTLAATLAAFVVVFSSSDGQFMPEQINPLSLNELFFGLEPSKGAGKVLASIGLTTFWGIALLTMGYSQWTKKSLVKSFLIVIFPYALYFGGLSLFL